MSHKVCECCLGFCEMYLEKLIGVLGLKGFGALDTASAP